MSSDPFEFDAALRETLDGHEVPPLSHDFAERVIGAAQDRAPPLPSARKEKPPRWRTGRRLVIGAAAAGALATAAAATGLLQQIGIDLPSPQQVWSAVTSGVTGQDRVPPPPAAAPEPAATQVPVEEAVRIEGPIDSPEELEEAFRRVDEARSSRREDRRRRVDDRIDEALERRRAQGLPAPTAEEEARLRQGIERFRERADQRREERTQQKREDLRRTLDEKGEITREDIIEGADGPAARRLREWRQLPPAERRARLREWREQRARRLDRLRDEQSGVRADEPPSPTAPAPAPAPAPDPATPDLPSPDSLPEPKR